MNAAQEVTSETMLRDLSVGNGSINATFDGGAMRLLVDAFANQFEESGAANYIEMQFHSNVTGPLVVTLQRVNGKTPHQLRAEVEQERDALRARISEMEQDAAHQKALAESALRVAEGWERKCGELRAENAGLVDDMNLLRDNNASLRARIEEMEKQEPIRLVTAVAYRWRYRGAVVWQYGELTEETVRVAKDHNHEVQALYLATGAKGEEK